MITSTTALRNSLLATESILDRVECDAGRAGKPYQWSPGDAVRDAIVALDERDEVRAKLAALFALLDIEEETDEGRVFKPNQLGGSCRALDGDKINRLFAELKAFAAAAP